MRLLYNISIQLMILAIRVSTIVNSKSKLWIAGRKNIFKRLGAATKDCNDVVWFHCASLGEFEQGIPIIKGYKEQNQKHKILLTFFSPSGYEIIKNQHKDIDWVFYLPADTPSNAARFIDTIKPIKAIFIKYEFWFNYMRKLKEEGVPLYIASAIFRSNQSFFRSKWLANELKNTTHIFVQNHLSKELLKKINIQNVTISGDSRFDRVQLRAKKEIKSEKLLWMKDFQKKSKTIVAGSTWSKDEKILIEFIKNNPQFNYIIVPHEIKRSPNLARRINGMLYSKQLKENKFSDNNILIIDTVGLLFSLYRYADITYVGGGFDSGIHNILEPASFGKSIIFGPKYQKAQEAKQLIQLKAAISIRTQDQLKNAIDKLEKLDNSICLNYIKKNSGSSNLILSKIKDYTV